jgi:hypothetical protein
MRSFAVSFETTRGADVPGTRRVVFPGRGLHHASPAGPWTPGSEPILLRLRSPPRGHRTLTGTKGMTVLPPIFDTIPDLGATKLRAIFL